MSLLMTSQTKFCEKMARIEVLFALQFEKLYTCKNNIHMLTYTLFYISTTLTRTTEPQVWLKVNHHLTTRPTYMIDVPRNRARRVTYF